MTQSLAWSKTLPVPYFVQPTHNTCQSTVLKMLATYLEQSIVFQSTGALQLNIQDIYRQVNSGPGRPSQLTNAHVNFKWWLEKRFPSLRFDYFTTSSEADAAKYIVQAIDSDMPVLMSVSHALVKGHIVLAVGYENYLQRTSAADFKIVVHDPYGRFDPLLHSVSHGRDRWVGGQTMAAGSETGPGQGCRLHIRAVCRHREGDSAFGTYFLLSPRR